MARIMMCGRLGAGALSALLASTIAWGAAAEQEKPKAKPPADKPTAARADDKAPAAKDKDKDEAKDKDKGKSKAPAVKVSFDKQIRPILQANCQGCHQPSKAGGDYVMTGFDQLLKGGESEQAAVVPGHPDESYLVEQITPVDGDAEMPQDKPPLSVAEIELISRWIAEGAHDDRPRDIQAHYDEKHPPVYTRLPVVPALAYSPDGSLLAVAGFHEVLLWKSDGSELVGRLIGLSERVESLAFSPDGKKLAVTGGLPSRMGEVQIWDVASRKLALSVPVTYDTVFGASWSPDGGTIAFGCTDNTVRAIDARTGKQVLFMGSHSDWALDTVFSRDGKNVISVGRDMSVKLTEIATQRFIDNISSITPGALKGGLAAVARHPERDEIVIGGSDGGPKLYRVFRQTSRVIGDDSNLVRDFPPLKGRIYGVAISDDGKRIAAGSSLDGTGEIAVYSYEFDTSYPDRIKAINSKVVTSRSAAEVAELEKYHKEGVKELSRVEVPEGPVYAVAFQPLGADKAKAKGAAHVLAAAGGDGLVRLINAETGSLLKKFAPVTVQAAVAANKRPAPLVAPKTEAALETEAPPRGARVASLQVAPGEARLKGRFAYNQLLVTARLDTGETIDATRMVETSLSKPVVSVSRSGLLRPIADGEARLVLKLDGRSLEVPVIVEGLSQKTRVNFVQDVAPLISRIGCNAGTCHGAAKGKNGFKLSLRGYDPIFDVRALTDDHASRRVNVASPDDSMVLLKPTGAAPHVGGVLFHPGEPYYEIIHSWIDDGAKLDLKAPRVKKIEVAPIDPVVQRPGTRQQLRVVATYSDGAVRDVTSEAFLESANTEVATSARGGLVTAVRRGEAPILARFEGSYASTTLTVMGDRTGFVWADPPSYGPIDTLAAAKWKRMKIQPSGLCSDLEFLRRASLDLTGLPPTADAVRAFLADKSDSRAKRAALVDRLIGGPDFIEYWTNKWADLLQVNRKFLGVEGARSFRAWIRTNVEKNTPYDRFVSSILTATGSNLDNPAASYYKILREPTATMENTTQLFLGIRFNCNKCHDHPFERWTQDQYYETAAYFAQVAFQPDPKSKGRMIGGTAVEGAKPLFEIVTDTSKAEVVHDRTHEPTAPKFPYRDAHPAPPEGAPRRVELASWMVSKDNPYFARSYVNRLWGYMFGVGIIEPLDDIRAGNPPSNPELLDYLTSEFVAHGFDARHVMRLICQSRTYQLSVKSNKWNVDDKVNYSHAVARRLPAEVLLDSVYRVTGSSSKIPGVPPGTRAAALPDSGVDLPSGFLTTFGRPVRESACECERSDSMQLGPVMALVSGPTLADAIADPTNDLARLVAEQGDDARLINELFLRVLNRAATPEEVATCRQNMQAVEKDHERLAEELGRQEAAFAVQRPNLERERASAIAAAEAALAKYEKEQAPRLAEQAKQRAEATARLEADLKAYEAGALAKKRADWEKANAASIVNRWAVLAPKAATSTSGAVLTARPDGSVLVSGKNQNGVVTVVVETDLADISGLRLEVLPDPSLPQNGPGRSGDGNFVLNEIELTAAPKADPKQARPVKLQKPLADFSQANFPIANAIDGNANAANNGWAVAPAIGTVHWATFEPAQPAGGPGGTVLTFKLHHQFNNVWTIGRFRLSATRGAGPIGLGLPEDFRAVLAVAPSVRTAAQNAMLDGYFRAVDPDLRAKIAAVAASKAAPAPDPMLKSLKDRIESAKRPVQPGPALAALRRDVEMSVQQAAARRLTATQDIAWALINSPAFLFNH